VISDEYFFPALISVYNIKGTDVSILPVVASIKMPLLLHTTVAGVCYQDSTIFFIYFPLHFSKVMHILLT